MQATWFKAGLVGVGLIAAAPAWADPRIPAQVHVDVGDAVPLKLGFLAMEGTCDDPSVVRIEVAPDRLHMEAVGLREGKTLCSFQENPEANRRVVQVVVSPREPIYGG